MLGERQISLFYSFGNKRTFRMSIASTKYEGIGKIKSSKHERILSRSIIITQSLSKMYTCSI